MKKFIIVSLFTVSFSGLFAQQAETEIQDNSFFIEEAFNQEPGVVQHIFTGFYNPDPDELSISFTQEWPLFSQDHQLSYTIPFSVLEEVSGLNDIMINYRYQLFYSDDGAAVSPRLSVILPTGDPGKGLGDDVTGVQFNLPVSKHLSNDIISHFNTGFTLLPGVSDQDLNLLSYNAGISFIWLAAETMNLMMEYSFNSYEGINENQNKARVTEHIFNPGIRLALNFGEMQIVPGLAVPLIISEGKNTAGIFLYLSFEHPF